MFGALHRLLARTPLRTFLIYPVCVVAFELAIRRGLIVVIPSGALLLTWGYLQYRLTGNYRLLHGGGGPGITVPPEWLVVGGPYAYTRNPMYLGHLIFMIGLAVTFWSLFAVLLNIGVDALVDEARLRVQFGPQYTDYEGWVKRWIPGLL